MIVGLLAGLVPLLPVGVVVADDAVVATCSEADFNAALATAQLNGGETIVFDCSGTITFTSRKTITSDVTIIGNTSVIFDGNNSSSFFRVNGGASLELIGLTLQNGFTTARGGAIRNEGTLTITASTFSGNDSRTQAGAILSVGTATITASTFNGNTLSNPDNASSIGGAVINEFGSMTITASTFSGNSAHFSGAIDNFEGTLTIDASTFTGNTAGGRGGAVYNELGTTDITASTFSGNSSGASGTLSSTMVER